MLYEYDSRYNTKKYNTLQFPHNLWIHLYVNDISPELTDLFKYNPFKKMGFTTTISKNLTLSAYW